MAAAWDTLLRPTALQGAALCHQEGRSRVCEARVRSSVAGDSSFGAIRGRGLVRHSQQQLCRCGSGRFFLKGVEQRTRILAAGRQGGGGGGQEEDTGRSSDGGSPESRPPGEDPIVDQALNLDGKIPPTSDGFLKTVSSRAYDMRRQLQQNMDASSYDVLEANPWRDSSKPVYVLAKEQDELLTMRTRRVRSEVERELGLLFPKRGSRRGNPKRPTPTYENVSSSMPTTTDNRFRMSVEDVREGVLVFEDEEEATRYCSLLDGQGKSCMGVAELDASDVFAMCQKTQALAVVFRRGQTPPQPDRLQLNLKARKRSLED